ncbi:MAG: polyprenyl synthetase family protein [Bacteroidota bacterium]
MVSFLKKKKTLKDIKAPIAAEMKIFDQYFKKSIASRIPLLDKITYYIASRKGKQMRPMFVIFCAKLLAPVTESTYIAAACVELGHTSTLVHDDVIDDSNERRGFFSIKALWKNRIAVLVGDYLISRCYLLAIRNKEYQLLDFMATATEQIMEGELLQLEKARRLDINESVYYEVINGKTASLIASACMAGAASVSDDEVAIENARILGEKIGMAFQIKDDLFDYGTDDVGKPLGNDIKEKKMTLPLIHALEKAPRRTKKRIINIIKKNDNQPERVAEVINFVKESGGLEYATKVMYRYRSEAFEILDRFPDSEVKTSLRDLINYVTERKK